VAAHSVVQATSETLGQWRRQPPPLAGQPLPGSFLKHSDDQTVLAVAAVHQAITQAGWTGRPFTDWGVLAAANFFGRAGTAHTIQRYGQEGAWGVSPHTIPHHSLHAVSGTLSQVLKVNGPNFGISGAAQACHDAFLVAATVLAEGSVPGVWLVLTGHDHEHVPAEVPKAADPAQPALCEAAALALVPARGGEGGLHLRLGFELIRTGMPDLTLSALVAALACAAEPAGLAWRLPGAGWVELEVRLAGVESRR
jgi:hypothetical protein